MLLSICVESNNRLRDYSTLEPAIAGLGEARQVVRWTWLLHPRVPDMTAVVATVRQHIDNDIDRLFVAEITGRRLDGWLRRDLWDWANDNNN